MTSKAKQKKIRLGPQMFNFWTTKTWGQGAQSPPIRFSLIVCLSIFIEQRCGSEKKRFLN